MNAPTLWQGGPVATLAQGQWGHLPQGAVLVDAQGRIAWVGPQAQADAACAGVADLQRRDLQGALLTPGLVDAHTHLVYGGSRADEAEQRLSGVPYATLAQQGGGIASTVRATRTASSADLLASAQSRARQLMRGGVTTLEIKSGYGLSAEHEARCLQVARQLGQDLGVTVRTTGLAAHALPPEFAGRPDAYIDSVVASLPQWHAQGLLDAVDAFCEHIAFSPAQVERVFQAARALGLPVKLHAEQLSNQGGAALAARYGALSCDHLEHLDADGIAAMKAAGTVAVLLPGAYYVLRDTVCPPVAALRAAGVPLAVSTDHNPGTSPALSLTLMAHMACTLFHLTPLEAALGITVNAARALGLHDRGELVVGARADFALWDLAHPNEWAYQFGHQACVGLVVAGQEIFP